MIGLINPFSSASEIQAYNARYASVGNPYTKIIFLFVLSNQFFFKMWCNNYRLTHSASELLGFTCTSSLTMNKKFQYRTRPPRAVLKNFEFIVSERVQVNPNNSRAMSALTFLLFKLNTLQAKIVKFWVSQSHDVMTVVYRIYTTAITPR